MSRPRPSGPENVGPHLRHGGDPGIWAGPVEVERMNVRFPHRKGIAMTVSVNGLSFHVVDEGSGPPVLLLHGFPDSSALWRHQIPALVDAGHRVIAPDLRGSARATGRGRRGVRHAGRDR
jgi:hypothetical protein